MNEPYPNRRTGEFHSGFDPGPEVNSSSSNSTGSKRVYSPVPAVESGSIGMSAKRGSAPSR